MLEFRMLQSTPRSDFKSSFLGDIIDFLAFLGSHGFKMYSSQLECFEFSLWPPSIWIWLIEHSITHPITFPSSVVFLHWRNHKVSKVVLVYWNRKDNQQPPANIRQPSKTFCFSNEIRLPEKSTHWYKIWHISNAKHLLKDTNNDIDNFLYLFHFR